MYLHGLNSQQQEKIPKILHYVWCGGAEKSDLIISRIQSWKKFCPDWEIREWNDDDLKSIKSVYVKEAKACKQWAFVSDYLRLYALNQYGGIYLDTDVELTAPLDLFLENHDFFIGLQISWIGPWEAGQPL